MPLVAWSEKWAKEGRLTQRGAKQARASRPRARGR